MKWRGDEQGVAEGLHPSGTGRILQRQSEEEL